MGLCAKLPRAARDRKRRKMHFNHFNFDFSAVKVLWALTFAALLVLMVVLLGRDRARRFPFFTVSIVLLALRLLMSRLLYGKLPSFTLGEIFLTLADLTALAGLLVLVELARQAFDGLQRSLWIVNSTGLLAVAGTVIVLWGPWPTWKTLTADSHTAALRFMQLFAEKADTLVLMMTIGLGLAVILFGRRYKAGCGYFATGPDHSAGSYRTHRRAAYTSGSRSHCELQRQTDQHQHRRVSGRAGVVDRVFVDGRTRSRCRAGRATSGRGTIRRNYRAATF
jgi:hypothetical protein